MRAAASDSSSFVVGPGVDSLHYLSLEGMLACVTKPADDYCTACFSELTASCPAVRKRITSGFVDWALMRYDE